MLQKDYRTMQMQVDHQETEDGHKEPEIDLYI